MNTPTIPTPPDDRLWTVKDVARYLGVSASWVYQHVAAGELPYRRIGGLVRFFPEDVRAYARGEPASSPVLPLRR
ncbi:MAG TPA: helix-turn-helix domain-containing protein [Anaeromyxobacter sp.]|nr:helix-turn-helix domain-containing protein [Anaeromyxobacter sp.]